MANTISLDEEMTPGDPEGEGEIWGPNAPVLSNIKKEPSMAQMKRKGKTTTQILREYFRTTGQKAPDFLKEMNQLSDEDKLELAQGAAKELGYSPSVLQFPLS